VLCRRDDAVTLALLLLAAMAQASECGEPCGPDAECARERATCLIEAGEHRQALRTLEAAHEAHPEQGDLVHRMAAAYLADGNTMWATRRLLERVEEHPEDLETRTWAAWVLIEDGDLTRASLVLPEPFDPSAGPLQARATLMRAALHHFRGEPEAAEDLLGEVRRDATALYPEDLSLQRLLGAQVLGDPGDPWSGRVWLTAGYTTNATETSPQSVGGEGSEGSVVTVLDAVVRHEPWVSRWARPRTEARFKTQIPWAALPFAYAAITARAGAELGSPDGVRARLLYSFELLGDNTGDTYTDASQRLFMEAHRGEVEVDLLPEVQLFGGGGRRVFRRMDRTRSELDGGVALVKGWSSGWNLTGILAGRWQRARHPDWSLVGGTALVRAAAPLQAGAMFKARVMVLRDAYPDHALSRRDWTFRSQAGPWSPSLKGWRVGLTYGFNNRWSAGDWAASADPYSYSRPDHRVLVEVRRQGTWRTGAARTVGVPEHHVPPPYGGTEAADTGLDRVQDLLRQEDSARRGSSCVD
jgi:hypothetical protein